MTTVLPNVFLMSSPQPEREDEMEPVKDQRPQRTTISPIKGDVLDALREIGRLLTNSGADEASRFARGLIDKIVVDGPAIAVHHSFKEPDEPSLVAQLWLPAAGRNPNFPDLQCLRYR